MYLESVITEDCKCHEEVKRPIATGKEAFRKPELLKDEVGVEEENSKDSDSEYDIVCP